MSITGLRARKNVESADLNPKEGVKVAVKMTDGHVYECKTIGEGEALAKAHPKAPPAANIDVPKAKMPRAIKKVNGTLLGDPELNSAGFFEVGNVWLTPHEFHGGLSISEAENSKRKSAK